MLDLEDRRGLPLHGAWVLVFDGPAPSHARLTEHVAARLERVPRYRRRVVEVPLRQGRPVWADDPHLHLGYHVRVEGLPGAADEAALARLAGRVLSQRLDRHKPLWEIHLVEGLRSDRFALIVKSHEALVDGERNLDIAGALFDESGPRRRRRPAAERADRAAAEPAQLLAGALAERVRDPREALESLRGAALRACARSSSAAISTRSRASAPRRCHAAQRPGRARGGASSGSTPTSSRCARAKERLGGTLNDVVLTAVAGAVGGYLRAHGETTNGLVLRALIPVADARGGRLLAAYVPLPVGIEDARRRHAEISRALDGLRDSGRAAGADELSALAGFAPASMIGAAARLQVDHRAFNLMVTNVPGPQEPRYLLGRAMRSIYPALPLGIGQALSIAVISYAGRLCFGLLGDDDAIPDPELLAGFLAESLAELPPRARPPQPR